MEIKAALAGDYRIAYSLYESMEKQVRTALDAGKMDDYNKLTKKAVYRAAVLGIDKVEFMEAVNADR